ncbi:TPA: dehydrogenase [Candidatus Latescibacteria bacterium]|mgnify:FL=1|nr:dehydrogenase [Candidatus Latescibacterota bacterium]|tara:strand:+ start:1348 stop:2331 length:984 start_codon:yes stop_codon:yes gene_type:complete
MPDPFRWGILGCGNIAKKFATGLQSLDNATLAAVGSRSQENADRFADEFPADRRHASYEALAADPDVDAIYVATPHPFHLENSVLCLRNKKPVLCEKPFTINRAQAKELVAVSQDENVFLMEAMWSRFLPLLVRVRELIADGAIGEVRMLQADFGFRANVNPNGRLFNLDLGGGGLLDVGVYTVSLASMILGTPDDIMSTAEIGETGVDEQAAIIFKYDSGQMALLATGVRTRTPHEATILGTDGYIRLHSSWWNGSKGTLVRGNDSEPLETPTVGNGYNYEAEEVARCVAEGLIESPAMPHDESIAVMGTLDTIRAQWGLKYPMES